MIKKRKERLVNVLIVLIIIGILLFIFNQAFLFIYRAQIMADPCTRCEEINPRVYDCMHGNYITQLENLEIIKINITNPLKAG